MRIALASEDRRFFYPQWEQRTELWCFVRKIKDLVVSHIIQEGLDQREDQRSEATGNGEDQRQARQAPEAGSRGNRGEEQRGSKGAGAQSGHVCTRGGARGQGSSPVLASSGAVGP